MLTTRREELDEGASRNGFGSGVVLYLTRHGQTRWNAEGRMQGEGDSPLTDTGLSQVEAVAEALERAVQGRALLISSPLDRALTSARVFGNGLGCEVWTHELLAELRFGRASGLTRSEIASRWPELTAERETNRWETRWPGGESYADLAVRARAFLYELTSNTHWRARLHAVQNVVIVAHQSTNMALLHGLSGMAPNACMQLRQTNSEIWRVDANSLARLDSGASVPIWMKIADPGSLGSPSSTSPALAATPV